MESMTLLDVPAVQKPEPEPRPFAVEVGQVWRAWEVWQTWEGCTKVRHTRDRRLRVVETDGAHAVLENVETGRRTRIAVARMKQTAATRGFELEE